MAKLVDAPASGAGDRKVVGVRVPSWAPNTPTCPNMGSNQQITSRYYFALSLFLSILGEPKTSGCIDCHTNHQRWDHFPAEIESN